MKWRNLHISSDEYVQSLRTQTPHEILGVNIGASQQEVKRAHRKKLLLYHPDRIDPFLRPHSEELCRLINAAYATLGRSDNI